MKYFLFFLSLFFLIEISAEETLNWDIESIFDEPVENISDTGESSQEQNTNEITVLEMINRKSLTFDIAYGFSAGVSPGWTNPPWHDSEENDFSWNLGAVLSSSFTVDARISRVFRVMSNFNFVIPDTTDTTYRYFRFNLGDFFFDYNLFDTVFFRGGKYNLKWGISPNFDFTNLLARVPEKGFTRDSFILKADIPAGIGGFQLLALTRANFMNDDALNREGIGFGGKYNLALRKIDMDTGVFYHHDMPLRFFLSLKTTLGSTEFYSEGLAAFNLEESHIGGAFNLGFVHEFNKLTANGEFFYNNEEDSFLYTSKTDFQDAKTSRFVEGVNIALNLLYRFGGKGNPRFYLQTLYAVQDKSARIVPAFRLSPVSHIDFYLGFPVVLGDKDGYYYKNSLFQNGKPLRFAAVFLVSLTGNLRVTVYPD